MREAKPVEEGSNIMSNRESSGNDVNYHRFLYEVGLDCRSLAIGFSDGVQRVDDYGLGW